jgi:hypothetical protein
MQINIASMHIMAHSDEQIKAFSLTNLSLACMLSDKHGYINIGWPRHAHS